MIGEGGLLTFIATTNTYLQTNVEENMRGRVISYYVMAFGGMLPMGSLAVGLLAHLTSAPFTVLVEGLRELLLFFSLFRLLKKQLKEQKKKQED